MRLPAAMLLAVLPAAAHPAEDLHAGLDEIAERIVGLAAEGSTVAVSTVTHDDGTCSELSNFASETLINDLFTASEGRLRLIERSQLGAIFREMNLVFDGTVAPAAARRLGEIQGVESIVTGRVTTFGETVQVVARLIGTEDGAVLAVAEADFPLLDAVEAMMAGRSREACGFAPAPGGDDATPAGERPRPEGGPTFASDVFEAEVVGLHYAPSTGEASAAIRFRNTSEAPIGLSYVSKSLAVADGAGGFMSLKDTWSGIRVCSTTRSRCTAGNSSYATTIPAGKAAQLNFDLEGASDVEDPSLTMSMEFVVTPNAADTETYDVRMVSFFDVAPSTR